MSRKIFKIVIFLSIFLFLSFIFTLILSDSKNVKSAVIIESPNFVKKNVESNEEKNKKDPSEPINQEVNPYYTGYQYESLKDQFIRYEYYIKNLNKVKSNFGNLLGSITENSTFDITANKKNINTAEKIKKYLWGDNLWKVDSNITKDQVRLERTEAEILDEKREVEILLENINLPNNISNEILHNNFIYRLHPKVPETNLANTDSIEFLVNIFENEFLKNLISKIKMVKQEDLDLSILEKKVLSDKTKNLIDVNTAEKLENDFFFLDFRSTEISESDIRKGLETLTLLSAHEIIFCENYELKIYTNRLNSIKNFLAYEGLQIPDSMIDRVTGEFILNPVLLDIEDTFFVDSTTKESFIRDGLNNPFSNETIIPIYLLSPNERKKHDERSGEMLTEIENFIKRLGQRFSLFFNHLRNYNKTIELDRPAKIKK